MGGYGKQVSKVNLLVPSRFDSRPLLELCIRSLHRNTRYANFDIIVCDAGVDKEARKFLDAELGRGSIGLIEATDKNNPKDDLVAAADAPYYVLLHDDIYIENSDWLSRRMNVIEADALVVSVGPTTRNLKIRGQRYFPMGLLIRKAAAAEMGLRWARQKGFDTGALAYVTLRSQSKYRHVEYSPAPDIHHFAQMTWPLVKNASFESTKKLLHERDIKMGVIHEMLRNQRYGGE